jgi:hypothetical protein
MAFGRCVSVEMGDDCDNGGMRANMKVHIECQIFLLLRMHSRLLKRSTARASTSSTYVRTLVKAVEIP